MFLAISVRGLARVNLDARHSLHAFSHLDQSDLFNHRFSEHHVNRYHCYHQNTESPQITANALKYCPCSLTERIQSFQNKTNRGNAEESCRSVLEGDNTTNALKTLQRLYKVTKRCILEA